MPGYGLKLPVTTDPEDGFLLTKSIKETTAQNLKMLVLTSPGERIMDPLFGVGIYNFLFELNNASTHGLISAKIHEQVNRYLSHVEVTKIRYQTPFVDESLDPNFLGISIEYTILSLKEEDILNLEVKI